MKIEFKSVPPIRCPLCRGPYFIEEGTEYPSLECEGCKNPPEGPSPIEALKDIASFSDHEDERERILHFRWHAVQQARIALLNAGVARESAPRALEAEGECDYALSEAYANSRVWIGIKEPGGTRSADVGVLFNEDGVSIDVWNGRDDESTLVMQPHLLWDDLEG